MGLGSVPCMSSTACPVRHWGSPLSIFCHNVKEFCNSAPPCLHTRTWTRACWQLLPSKPPCKPACRCDLFSVCLEANNHVLIPTFHTLLRASQPHHTPALGRATTPAHLAAMLFTFLAEHATRFAAQFRPSWTVTGCHCRPAASHCALPLPGRCSRRI